MNDEDERLPLSGKRWIWVLGALVVVLAVAVMVAVVPRGLSEPEGDPANAVATTGAPGGVATSTGQAG